MLGSTLFSVIALTSFAQLCVPLPVNEVSVQNREASPQWLPGAGETADQADSTIASEQGGSWSSWPWKDKRDSAPLNIEKDFPLTHAVMMMIRDAIPEQDNGLHKRQNSSDPSGIKGLSNLDPQTQSTLKDTIRYGIALVMKTGSWALSP